MRFVAPLQSLSRTIRLFPRILLSSVRLISNQLIVRGLDEAISRDEAKNIFKEYGYVYYVGDEDSAKIVKFKNLGDAIAAKEDLDNTLLRGRRVFISFSKKREERTMEEKYQQFLENHSKEMQEIREMSKRPNDLALPQSWLRELSNGASNRTRTPPTTTATPPTTTTTTSPSNSTTNRAKSQAVDSKPLPWWNRPPDLVFEDIPSVIFEDKATLLGNISQLVDQVSRRDFVLWDRPHTAVVWLQDSQAVGRVVKALNNKEFQGRIAWSLKDSLPSSDEGDTEAVEAVVGVLNEKEITWRLKVTPFSSFPSNTNWKYEAHIKTGR